MSRRELRAFLSFFFHSSGDHRDLHSFPTRRSSDLSVAHQQASTPARQASSGVAAARAVAPKVPSRATRCLDRKSTRLNSSHVKISYAVFCLKKKNKHSSSSHSTLLSHPSSPASITP